MRHQLHAGCAGVDIQHLTYGGKPAIRLCGPGRDSATLQLRGGQLVSWINTRGQELLQGTWRPGGCAPFHSLASSCVACVPHSTWDSDAEWWLDDAWFLRGVPHVRLRLHGATMAHRRRRAPFDCCLHLALDSPDVQLTLQVVNTGTAVVCFDAGLQPCFRLPAPAGGLRADPREVEAAAWSHRHVRLPSAGGWVDVHHAGFDVVCVLRHCRPGPCATTEFACIRATTAVQPVQLAPGGTWLASQQLRWMPEVAGQCGVAGGG